MLVLLTVLGGLLLMAGCLAGAFYILRKKRIIDDLPTSQTQGVFIGLSELKGTAESEQPFSAYLSGLKCVTFHWRVEEEWRRTVTATYRDSKGHMQTRTRNESGWKQVAAGQEQAPFYLKDESGLIRVDPQGASLHDISVFNQTVSPASPLYYDKGPSAAIANSTLRRRFTEHALPLHSRIYVLGQARLREDAVAAEIAQDKKAPLFLISTQTEKQISRGYAVWFGLWTLLGLLCALGGGAGWSLLADNQLKWERPLIMAAIYLALLLLVYIWTTYNNLINLHHRVEQGWSQVDVQLKRRHDLIPNLVQVVEGYRRYEKETQSFLTALRSQMEATPAGQPGSDYQGLSLSLRLLSEKYPDLKAAGNFLQLQRSLADTEQRIALARDYFNQVATFYNTRLEIIPERYVATLARLKSRQLMSAADFERAPSVSGLLNNPSMPTRWHLKVPPCRHDSSL
jgi:hypothetical protein